MNRKRAPGPFSNLVVWGVALPSRSLVYQSQASTQDRARVSKWRLCLLPTTSPRGRHVSCGDGPPSAYGSKSCNFSDHKACLDPLAVWSCSQPLSSQLAHDSRIRSLHKTPLFEKGATRLCQRHLASGILPRPPIFMNPVWGGELVRGP